MNLSKEIAEKILNIPYDGEDFENIDFLAVDILKHRDIPFSIIHDAEEGYMIILEGHNKKYKTQGKRLGKAICECLLERYKGERG